MITITSGELRRLLEPLLIVAGAEGHVELKCGHGWLGGRATDKTLLLANTAHVDGDDHGPMCVNPADVKTFLASLPRKKGEPVVLHWGPLTITSSAGASLYEDERPWPEWTKAVVLRTCQHHYADEHDAAATWSRDTAERVGKIFGYAEGTVQVRVADLVPSLITATNLILHVAGSRVPTIDPSPRGL